MASIIQIVSLVAYCILSILDLRFRYTVRERYVKPLLMPVLIVFYLSSAVALGLEIRYLLVPALFCGFLGDTFLLDDKYFIPGLASFLAGHVFYILEYLRNTKFSWLRPIPVIVVLMGYILYLIIVVQNLMPSVDRQMRLPVGLYMAVILAMSFSSYLMYMTGKTAGRIVTWVGTILFIVSDTILAFNVFRKKSGAGIMPTYIAAQFLIVLGMLI
ncbi:MAG: lysoplasmalogenase [Eubacterium sp.]|nr:lysoplasmalogenase [Eubacterium sp.]